VFCTPASVACSVIDGRVVVRDGQLSTLELGPLLERHNRLARALVDGEP
jgi:8-oxoguanine deaminase